jgi:hypothetical protein
VIEDYWRSNNGTQRRPRSEFLMVARSVTRGLADAERWADYRGHERVHYQQVY